MTENGFHWADYLIFALFLVISAGIGVVVSLLNRRKQTDAKDFLTGGGDMHWFPVSLSMTASFMSAIFVISIPGEVYYYGSTYCFLAMSYLTGYTFAGHVHLPIMHRLGITSGYQYLEMRFNRTVRLASSVTFSVMMFLYNGVVLYTPAVALSQVSGIETYISILLVGGVVTFYTALGGLKATVWNDALQASIILLNFVLILIFGSINVGGLDEALRIAKEDGIDTLYDPKTYDPNPFIRTTFWTQSIGGTFMNLVLYSSSQTVIQKFLSIKSIKKAQIAVWISAASTGFYMVLVFFVGCIMYAKYRFCDPILSGKVTKIDQIMSNFVLDVMGHLHGLPGLFLAAAFSATLSTVAGGLNAMATVYLEDFIAPAYLNLKGKPLEASVAKVLTRCLAILFGLLTIAVAFLSEVMGSLAVQIALSIFGMVGAPICGTLTLGMFFPFANAWGALAGLLSSLGLTLWIGIGSIVEGIPIKQWEKNISGCDFPDFEYNTTVYPTSPVTQSFTTALPVDNGDDVLYIYRLSYVYYSLFAILVVFIVGIVVSLITGGNTEEARKDPRFFYFCGDQVCCCCPIGCRTACRCGVTHGDVRTDRAFSVSSEYKEPIPEGTEIGYETELTNGVNTFDNYLTNNIHMNADTKQNIHCFDNSAYANDTENVKVLSPTDNLTEGHMTTQL